ncbi:MAG: electron transfer flavoprotein subunit alpha/FixB family protein [Selenomonas sp.]|uniref:electron transfer flavoprotein subunit alpha/FixB family protein n=1 Tax=Selenomonas sp. TaxID=2053611 RepID=UPI0025DC5B82|nr:electron transfer flavoprotein subunit alpha/FixB family protein [Selenomonas sp.]MCR5756355.1 electron transfer flavoprotein subunit alpha/FixB family protein [Selenomonas sp.]
MGKLVVHQDKIQDIKALMAICPFGAMTEKDGKVEVSAACRLCKLCVKKGNGAMEFVEDEPKVQIDKSKWQGIAVYIDHVDGRIHPVSFELLGKARELADKIHQQVFALFMGSDISIAAKELRHYGVDKVFVCDKKSLGEFNIESYAKVFEQFINQVKPAAILVGATPVGRQLAPRVAARFHTGLTADCTVLDIHENSDLVQIRPAFGGNIMAEILTPNTRPQMATVRYKIMDAPQRSKDATGTIEQLVVPDADLVSRISVLGITKKPKEKSIEHADVLVVAGRGIKKKEDLELVYQLAEALGGDFACTRPLIEAGWMDPRRQIGLSGRTVRPKLIITCGVSGAIQFVAGMEHSDEIFAINSDPKASIFKVANYAVVGDLYEIIPQLLAQIQQGRKIA